MNLHLLVLLLALFMTIARPIPIEFNAGLDPTYYSPVPQNLGLVQGGPTLENTNIAYSGTTVPTLVGTAQIPNQLPSFSDWDSPFHLADNTPANTPEAQSRVVESEDDSQAHCCEQRKEPDGVIGCKCVQSEGDRGGQLGGQSDGQSDGKPSGQSNSQSDGQSGRKEESDSGPGLWQLYVEPWLCAHLMRLGC